MAEEWERERKFLFTVLKLFIGVSVSGLVLYLALLFFSDGVATVLATVTFVVLVWDWALRGRPFDLLVGDPGKTRPPRGRRGMVVSGVAVTFLTATLLAFNTQGTARLVCIGVAIASGAVTAAVVRRRRRAAGRS